jgi:carbon-monoxide dehydrogenase medium subunit
VSTVPFVAPVSGEWSGGTTPHSRLAEEAAAAVRVRDEPGVSAHYRRGLVRTLVQRACEEAEQGGTAG